MKVEIFQAGALPKDLSLRWAELQQINPELSSPFFRFEFAEAVSTVRDDAYVAAIHDGAAFLPFQRNQFGAGRPIGGAVSDYHGLIAPSDYEVDLVELLQVCDLRYLDFDHAPASQKAFSSWHTAAAKSYLIDIVPSIATQSASHSRYKSKRRKLERELGNVEVEFDSVDPEMLRLCLKWKSMQYQQTGLNDLFARPWAQALVERIASRRDPAFSGMLSVLRAGGLPIAAHFGMRSNKTLHYWFPAYDPTFRKYSPGMLLLLAMISDAHVLGIETIDFGKGDMDYKHQLATRTVSLLEGSVAVHPSLLTLRRIPSKILSLARDTQIMKLIPTHTRQFIRRLIMSGHFR